MKANMQDQDIEPIAERQSRTQREMMSRGLTKLDDAVSELADADAAFGVAKLLALKLGLDTALIVNAVEAQSDEPATVLCRAAGLKTNAFSAVLRMRRRRMRAPMATPAEALTAYHRMPQEAAQKVVRLLETGLTGKSD